MTSVGKPPSRLAHSLMMDQIGAAWTESEMIIMAAPEQHSVPIEIVDDWTDSVPAMDPVSNRVPLPGEGLVDCIIIEGFANSGGSIPANENGSSRTDLDASAKSAP